MLLASHSVIDERFLLGLIFSLVIKHGFFVPFLFQAVFVVWGVVHLRGKCTCQKGV